MTESAFVKVERAAKHVADLEKLSAEARPYTYVLETDLYAAQEPPRVLQAHR